MSVDLPHIEAICDAATPGPCYAERRHVSRRDAGDVAGHVRADHCGVASDSKGWWMMASKRAGPVRNAPLVAVARSMAAKLYAFPDKTHSPGTNGCVKLAMDAGVWCKVVEP